MTQSPELVVEEPIAGHYYWMIVRPGRSGHEPTVIDRSFGPLNSRQAALQAGSRVFASYDEAERRPLPCGSGGAWDVATMPGALHAG